MYVQSLQPNRSSCNSSFKQSCIKSLRPSVTRSDPSLSHWKDRYNNRSRAQGKSIYFSVNQSTLELHLIQSVFFYGQFIFQSIFFSVIVQSISQLLSQSTRKYISFKSVFSVFFFSVKTSASVSVFNLLFFQSTPSSVN